MASLPHPSTCTHLALLGTEQQKSNQSSPWFAACPKHTPTLLPLGINTALAQPLAPHMVFLMTPVAFNYQYPQPSLATEAAILGAAGRCLLSRICACRAPLMSSCCPP